MGILVQSFKERTLKKMESKFIIAFFALIAINIIKAENVKEAGKEGKMFSLFSVVSFKNVGCSTTSTTGSKNRNGTCYTSSECTSKGGTASGNCAAGFGVCCLFLYKTGSEDVSQNCSYIQNPNYPSAYGSTTSIYWNVKKCSKDICTIRLDFCTFTTAGPTGTTDGSTPNPDTTMDTFTITTSPTQYPIPLIAGENTGEHVYIEIGQDSTAFTKLTFAIGSRTTVSRVWEIKVTQLECWSKSRPHDTGCLQYYTGTTGRITSFNFAQSSSSNYQHLHSQNYNICVRKEAGYCCVQYYPCSDTSSWSISAQATTAQTSTNCVTDLLLINGGALACSNTNYYDSENKFCGAKFSAAQGGNINAAICDCTTPFNIQFVTNAPKI